MKNRTVYLAGPITGLTYDTAQDWRVQVAARLKDVGIDAYSPLRAKHYLKPLKEIQGHSGEYNKLGLLSGIKAVTTRDRHDATTCGVLFVNFLGAKTVSIGTVLEIAWADAHRIPIVCVMEEEGNPHDHMMIKDLIGFRLTNLDDAVYVTATILNP